MNVDLKAAWNIAQTVAGKMIEAGKGGSIVNISTFVRQLTDQFS
jgi:NAD(P)-dependent dehydrogenase (short-subunit alcohol dehydrogenase family)